MLEAMQSRAVETRKKLLLAAATVIRRDGAANLTLDKVAEEAKISKGGLLYHFRSKEELISHLVDLTFLKTEERLSSGTQDEGKRGDFVRSYLESARSPYNPTADQDISSSIMAEVALNGGYPLYSASRFGEWQERLVNDHDDETVALLARVVADGLCFLDVFGLAPLTEKQRDGVIDLVLSLLNGQAHN